ncbi:phosphoribosylformylglycinamidine synthase subunit PurQ [Coraliomargarita akajimensis]
MRPTFSLQTSPFRIQWMPHPERLFRAVQMSYRAPGTFEGEAGPWMKMFQNARSYVG